MESAIAKPKSDRATREQLEHYVQFYGANPEMGMGKNNLKSPQKMRCLWNQLAGELNSLRGPTRTAEKWKETLGVWKSQLRTRARRARMSQRVTGGGLPCSKRLNEFEERALPTFGLGSTGMNLPPTQELLSGIYSCIQQSSSPPESHAELPSRAPPTSATQSSTVSPEQNPALPSFSSLLSSSPPQSDALSVNSETSSHGVPPLKPETENSGVVAGGSARMSHGERSKLIITLIDNLSRSNTFEENRQRREEEQRQQHCETVQAIQELTSCVAELIQVLKQN